MSDKDEELKRLVGELQNSIGTGGMNAAIGGRFQTKEPIRMAGENAVAAATRLGDLRAVGGPISRIIASEQAYGVLVAICDPFRGRSGNSGRGIEGVGSRVEAKLAGIVRPLSALGYSGTLIRLVVTGLACIALMTGQIRLAFLLLTGRVILSALQDTPGTKSDKADGSVGLGSDSLDVDWATDWRACVLGHFTDAVVLICISALLSNQGHVYLGTLVSTIAIVALSGTLLRVAAVQSGVVLRRLHLERVMRNGFLLAGLGAAALPKPGSDVAPIVAVAAVGAAVYGAGEIWRVYRATAAARSVERRSTEFEMICRRVANVLPVVEQRVQTDYSTRPPEVEVVGTSAATA